MREIPTWQKGAFAFAAAAILLLATAAYVHDQSYRSGTKGEVDPHLRTIDLDFEVVGDGTGTVGYVAAGPLGQVELGARADHRLLAYSVGTHRVSLEAAGAGFEDLPAWRGRVGATSPVVDGVRATYLAFYPSTGLEVVSGIDGVELVLVMRSAPFVGAANLSYSFWVDASPGLVPVAGGRALEAGGPGPHIVSGAIPLVNGRGQTVLQISPAMAIIEYNEAPEPAADRGAALTYDDFFPGHRQGDREVVPLDYAVEFIGQRMKLSVLVPADLLWDPAIKWPVLVDPGITNPISNSSYFADETILMDSDLVVTATGAAQFSNVTIVMNATSAPNYEISVATGGRMTLLKSNVQSNDSQIPYLFSVNGTLTAQDTVIRHTSAGVRITSGNATLSNVTIEASAGDGLVLVDSGATISGLLVDSPPGVGINSTGSNLEAAEVNVTGAGADGLYLNATSGNITQSTITGSTLNGALVVGGSRVNVTFSAISDSGRNGILIIGGAPSVENSTVSQNGWSGIVTFDDHSAYLYGNRIANNTWSGVEARLNSTVDIYWNIIRDNGAAGVRTIAADPNLESNEILSNGKGVWLDGAHNGDAKPGDDGSTEGNYEYILTADSELQDQGPVPMTVTVDLEIVSPNPTNGDNGYPAQYQIQITNQVDGPPVAVDLAIASDENNWASLSQTFVLAVYLTPVMVTLSVEPGPDPDYGTQYDVQVTATMADPPFTPLDDVWAYTDVLRYTEVDVDSVFVPDDTLVELTAQLIWESQGQEGYTLAFKLDGEWVGEDETDQNGYAVLEHTVSLWPIAQTLQVYFNGTATEASAVGSASVLIDFTNTTLELDDSATVRWGDTGTLTVRLAADPGPGYLIGRWIHFGINGTYTGKAMTDGQGYAIWTFADTYEVGNIDWNASYDGGARSGSSNGSEQFASTKEITALHAAPMVIRQGETATYTAQLTDDEGLALTSFNLDVHRGATWLATVQTDGNGWASYQDSGTAALAEGNYTFKFVFTTDDHYAGTNVQYGLEVRRWSTTIEVPSLLSYWGDTALLRAQLRDEDGNNLSGEDVAVYLGGQLVDTETTDGDGWVEVADTDVLTVGLHALSFEYAGDGRNFGNASAGNLSVLRELTILQAVADARIWVGDVLQITIQLTEDDGPALARLINVSLFGAIYTNGTTDENGSLTVNFDSRGLLPMRYVLWYFFDGSENHSQSETYTRIIVDIDADLSGNRIEDNGVGVLANNSSSRIVGDLLTGNGEALVVANGSLLIYNSSVGLSSTADYRLATGGSIYSTNTTFNRQNVILDGGAVLLHVRYYMYVRTLVPANLSLEQSYQLVVTNTTGVEVYNQTATTTQFVRLLLTYYTQDEDGKDWKTPHRVTTATHGVTVTMDATRRITLYLGADADLDSLLNSLEDAADLRWFEAEGHTIEYTQLEDDKDASQGLAVAPLGGSLELTDPESYPPVEGGTYILLLRAKAGAQAADIRVRVVNSTDVELVNLTYTPDSRYRWFQTTEFALGDGEVPEVNVTAISAGGAEADLRLDELGIARLLDDQGVRVHWQGQITNAFDPDMDMDRGADGGETHPNIYWFEAETLTDPGDGGWVSDRGASNSWAVEHPTGDDEILSMNATDLPYVAVYEVRARGMGDGAAGLLQVDVYVDEQLDRTVNATFPQDEWAFVSVRFDKPGGADVVLVFRDGADTSQGLDSPVTRIDSFSLVAERIEPGVTYGYLDGGGWQPADGVNMVFVNPTAAAPETGNLWWLSDSGAWSTPVFTAFSNDSFPMSPISAYSISATQPVVFTPPKASPGSQFMAFTGGTNPPKVLVYSFPDLAPVSSQPVVGTPNGVAYSDGYIMFSTSEGWVYFFYVDPDGTLQPWAQYLVGNDEDLGAGMSTAAVHRDRAYFGFEHGLFVTPFIDVPVPNPFMWAIGDEDVEEWPHPATRCPFWTQQNSSCYDQAFPGDPPPDPPPPGPMWMTVAAPPAFDSGTVFVAAYRNDIAVLYKLTEDGEMIWAQDLGWDMSLDDTLQDPIRVQPFLRGNAVVIAGPVLEVFDSTWGSLLMAHDFGAGTWTDGWNASAIVTDREIIAPGPDAWYSFAFLDGEGWGESVGTDGNHTMNSTFPEDVLWHFDMDAAPSGVPLLGDFDNTGMRDLIFLNATSVVVLHDFEAGHRNYIEIGQAGRDASHNTNGEFLFPFVATDPLNPDMDFDGLPDAQEVSGFFGWQQVEAEDAYEHQAWAHNETPGAMKNFNFFHQTGVTLTADNDSITQGLAPNSSWIRFETEVADRGVYRMTLLSNTSVTNVEELRFLSGNASETQDPDTSDPLGQGLNLADRVQYPAEVNVPLTTGQRQRITEIVENATYLKVRYNTFDPAQDPGNFSYFGVKTDAEVSVYKSVYANNSTSNMWVTVFISMQIEFELIGGESGVPRTYQFEVGLNLSLVNWSGMGGDELPAELEMLRILDLDKLKFEKRGLNPFSPDSDNDSVPDGDEAGGFPWNADVDEDGISDYYEIYVYGTDAGDKDSDHDGIRDRVELGLTGETDAYTQWDTTDSWASYPEFLAAKFRGDPFFKMPTEDRVLSNNDTHPGTTTDPLDVDSDGDGIPDGWVDGWIYDPSFMVGQIQHSTATTEYLTRAQPMDYDLSFWRQSGIYDNYAQIWEGEDANLNGFKDGNEASQDPKYHWGFWPSITQEDGDPTDATLFSYIRRGWGETDAANPDTDGDGIPEGYEVWYATRSPIFYPGTETLYFTPVTDDGDLDVDAAYGDMQLAYNVTTYDPNSTVTISAGTASYLARGIHIPDPDEPDEALLATEVRLFLSAAETPTGVTLEVWRGPASATVPDRFLTKATALVSEDPGIVTFDIPDTWMNFSSNEYFAVLKNASSDLTWWKTGVGTNEYLVREDTEGVWTLSGASLQNWPGIQVIDAYSATGDGLTNYEEYLIGSNPKKRDTDAGTAGPTSALGDLLSDGAEMVNHTIFRTNAKLGTVTSLNYNGSSWILLDESLETHDLSDWMYFVYWEKAENPDQDFGGTKDRTSYLFTLSDGAELRINLSTSDIYIYLPGSDFENLINETDHDEQFQYYRGTALVFLDADPSGVSDDYKTNAIFGTWATTDPWLFFQQQFYASDPFDWDTDNDGLSDGQEVYPWRDDDGDFVPNVRDFDSDNDGLTDGQEMLQVQSDWNGENNTDAANLKFDPDGDGLYPMIDTDSDGDGIPDAKEVLWSVDTDGDNRINLVDWDSDGDGLCDGWCTDATTADWRDNITEGVPGWYITLPPGMPNGEDTNENGTNEQGESSPVKVDTDGDGLWDGYVRQNETLWILTQVDGGLCPRGHTATYLACGEESTYSRYTSPSTYTNKTNRTNPDSDGDGLTDTFEVSGWSTRFLAIGNVTKVRYTISDPTVADTDGDGVSDPGELILGTNTTLTDTDGDGLPDGLEDANRDGFRQSNETSAIMMDSDRDGLCDGNCTSPNASSGEDLNKDGVRDANEPDPLDDDSDGDGIKDGAEYAIMRAYSSGAWYIEHDFDGDGLTDLNDPDADDDGLSDLQEDRDRDGTINEALESNPYDADTDDDGLLDGAEASPWEDTDEDGTINIRDQNSNDDNFNDNLQVWVVFRTNALSGAYADEDTWVGLIAPSVNPYYPENFTYTASVALYEWDSTVTSVTGAGQIYNPYGPNGDERPPVALQTPEGYAVLQKEVSAGVYDIYLKVSDTQYERFTKEGTAPGDWSTSNRSQQAFLKNHQETYDGRVAIDMDPDFDLISTIAENLCNLNPNSADTDGDGITDTIEYRGCADFDGDSKPDANDTDSDGDAIPDQLEDANLNGRWDAGETNALGLDSDGDGLNDGVEDANRDGVQNAPGGVFNETSPIDRDTDDDGIEDKVELDGSWCYVWESTETCDPVGARETDPLDVDSDGDLLWDGQEIGLMSPGKGTDPAVFKPDANPKTTTDPTEDDTDDDGILDGTEDLNQNGRVDSGEADPQKWDTDADGLPDGNVTIASVVVGEDLNVNGIRDQDADGNWTETDFLANDSDVDGVLDGDEVNGSYCFNGGSCANSAHPLDPLDADSDMDGLRDGQELAGWIVGTWYERTMEKKLNYSVTSDPWDDNSDGDTLTDFSEFLNGSDPRSTDTDGDQISDTDEIALKSNITGIEGTPPQIANVSLNVGIKWDWWGFLYLPMRATVTVAFDVEDNVGIDRVEVRFIRYAGETKDTFRPGTAGCGSLQCHIVRVYEFSIFEALVAGADVNITAFDVNENGASGEFHVDSVLEAIAKAVAAFLSAIAKVIMEAASFLVDLFVAIGKAMFEPLFNLIMDGIEGFARMIQDTLSQTVAALGGYRANGDPADNAWTIFQGLFVSTFFLAFMALSAVIIGLDFLILPLQFTPIFFVKNILMDLLVSAIIGALGAAAVAGLEATTGNEGFTTAFTFLLGNFATGIAIGKAAKEFWLKMAPKANSRVPGGALVLALFGIVLAVAGAMNPRMGCDYQLTLALTGLALSVISLFKYLNEKKTPLMKLFTITPAVGVAGVAAAIVISGLAVAGTAVSCLSEE